MDLPYPPFLLILQGLPASGKSTLARKLQQSHPGSVIVSRDEIRISLSDRKMNDRKREQAAMAIRDRLIADALEAGKLVISEDCNLHPATLRELKRLATRARVGWQVERIHTPIQVCLTRDAARPAASRVGPGVIQDMWLQHCREDVEETVFLQDMADEEKRDPLSEIEGHFGHKTIAMPFPRTIRPLDLQIFRKAPKPASVIRRHILPDHVATGSIQSRFTDMGEILAFLISGMVIEPADLFIATWALKPRHVDQLRSYMDSGRLKRLRVTLDPSQVRAGITVPAMSLLALVGAKNFRLAPNHGKVLTLRSGSLALTLFGSPNFGTPATQSEWILTTTNPAVADAIERRFIAPIWSPPREQEEEGLSDEDDTIPGYLRRGIHAVNRAMRGISLPAQDMVVVTTAGDADLIHVLAWLCLELGGHATVTLCGWRMNRVSIQAIDHMRKTGIIADLRVILDKSGASREPESWPLVKATIPPDKLQDRTASHAKFATVAANGRKVALLTSANWNRNPRPEFVIIREGADMHEWLEAFSDGVFGTSRTPS